jgi:hypothetical protein
MRRLLTWSIAATLALTLGCADPLLNGPSPSIRLSPPGEAELVVGQAIRVLEEPGGAVAFTVTFRSVQDDSRCPVYASCVWAGDAAVELEVGGTATVAMVLHTPTTEIGPSTGYFGAYQIDLLELRPVPEVGTPRPRPYTARLRVTLRPLP